MNEVFTSQPSIYLEPNQRSLTDAFVALVRSNMALIDRIIPTRWKSKFNSKEDDASIITERLCSTLTPGQVRVLLFRECDSRGRKLLFDSDSVKKTNLEETPVQTNGWRARWKIKKDNEINKEKTYSEVSCGYGYQYTRPDPASTRALGDMVLGSVSMIYKGSCHRIHVMPDPCRLLCSKVMACRGSNKNSLGSSGSFPSLEDSFGSSLGSIDEQLSLSLSGSFSNSGNESGIGWDVSGSSWGTMTHLAAPSHLQVHPLSRPGSWTAAASSSCSSSASRRKAWSAATSLDSLPSSVDSHLSGQMRSKLAVAFLLPVPQDKDIQKRFERHFFMMASQIEELFTQMQLGIDIASQHKDKYFHHMWEASWQLRQGVVDLLRSPRVPSAWLTLTSSRSWKDDVAAKFLSDLYHLSSTCDTRNTNFFISTLLSSVLTHHLGWVVTVRPQLESLKASGKSESPLWFQLEEFQGALGSPSRMSRTLVYGQKAELVRRVLFVLSYFIRCLDLSVSELQLDVLQDNNDRQVQNQCLRCGLDASFRKSKPSHPVNGLWPHDERNGVDDEENDALQTIPENTGEMRTLKKCLYPNLNELDLGNSETCECNSNESCSVCERRPSLMGLKCMSSPEVIKPSFFLGDSDTDDQPNEPPKADYTNTMNGRRTSVCKSPSAPEKVVFCVGECSSDGEETQKPPCVQLNDTSFRVPQKEELRPLGRSATHIPKKISFHILKDQARSKSETAQDEETCQMMTSTCPKCGDTSSCDIPYSSVPDLGLCLSEADEYCNLYGGVSDRFISGLPMHGTTEARSSWDGKLRANLVSMSVPGKDALYILGDTDSWRVEVVSPRTGALPVMGMSLLVGSLIESVCELWRAGASTYQCLRHLEDSLCHVYQLSEVLGTMLLCGDLPGDLSSVTDALGVDSSDIQLLFNVATTHTPQITNVCGIAVR